MGEAARLCIRSIEAAGIPLVLNNVPSRLRRLDASYTGFTDARTLTHSISSIERGQHGMVRARTRAAVFP